MAPFPDDLPEPLSTEALFEPVALVAPVEPVAPEAPAKIVPLAERRAQKALGKNPGRPAADCRFSALLDQFADRIRHAALTHCAGNQGLDADDVIQEIHIRLWRGLASDRIEAVNASYIQRVVVSVVIDAARRAQVRSTEPLPEDDQPSMAQFAPGPTVEQVVGEQQRLDQVSRAMKSLPARRRVPLQLHMQGFSLGEIAELEQVSAEAARKLVSRGLAELKAQLKLMGVDEFEVGDV